MVLMATATLTAHAWAPRAAGKKIKAPTTMSREYNVIGVIAFSLSPWEECNPTEDLTARAGAHPARFVFGSTNFKGPKAYGLKDLMNEKVMIHAERDTLLIQGDHAVILVNGDMQFTVDKKEVSFLQGRLVTNLEVACSFTDHESGIDNAFDRIYTLEKEENQTTENMPPLDPHTDIPAPVDESWTNPDSDSSEIHDVDERKGMKNVIEQMLKDLHEERSYTLKTMGEVLLKTGEIEAMRYFYSHLEKLDKLELRYIALLHATIGQSEECHPVQQGL